MSTIERLKPNEPRAPISPQLALRVAALGGFALVMFAIIFFRLWYLQILTGEQYVQQAKVNDQRVLPIPAPRGEILDRSGTPIVTSTVANAVQIIPSSLPAAVREQAVAYQAALAGAQAEYVAARDRLKAYEADLHASRPTRAQGSELRTLRREAAHIRVVPIPPLPASATPVRRLFDRLAPVIRLSPRSIDERVVAGITQLPYAPATIKTDAGREALTVLGERRNEFPGVRQQQVSIRRYLYGEMAAQVLGHVGQVSEEELKLNAFRSVQQGTIVGKEGLEYYYDRYLRGVPGAEQVQVNSEGEPVPTNLPSTEPIAGRSVRLSLDLGLEREGERALREGISIAQASGKPANAGAYLAMDPRNGQVLAIGSYPGFDPNVFAKPLTQSEYDGLISGAGAPLIDRAVNGQYPTGSTFKPITAMAALEAGVINPNEAFGPGPCISVGGESFCNAGHAPLPAMALVEALKVSSDTYFFEVGKRANDYGNVIQRKAHQLGVGQPTGIDLPEEFSGVVPDRQWRETTQPGRAQVRAPRTQVVLRLCRRSQAVERRRQHAARRRPGGPADRPPADGRRLLDARKRLHARRLRHGRAPASGHGDRRRKRRPGTGAELTPGAQGAPHLLRPRSRNGRAAQGRQRIGRHLGGRVGRLESGAPSRLRQDRNR